MYKIVFIDIDGTLRNEKKEITKRTKESINKIVQKGIYVVICSGRPGKYVEDISKEALASNYIIACNGGEIYDYKSKNEIYSNVLEKEDIITLWHMAKKYELNAILISNGNRYVSKETDDISDTLLQDDIETFLESNSVVQVIVSSFNKEKINIMKKEVENMQKCKNIEIVNLSKCFVDKKYPANGLLFLDITSRDTSKGKAIKKLCNYLNVDLKDSVAIGDSYNDLTMFDAVGHSVAVGNATKEIKEKADEIIGDNNEDGVAQYLESML